MRRTILNKTTKAWSTPIKSTSYVIYNTNGTNKNIYDMKGKMNALCIKNCIKVFSSKTNNNNSSSKTNNNNYFVHEVHEQHEHLQAQQLCSVQKVHEQHESIFRHNNNCSKSNNYLWSVQNVHEVYEQLKHLQAQQHQQQLCRCSKD